MEWKVRCYHNDGDDNIIGAEVIAYKGNDVISKIVLTDETQLNELSRKLDNLNDKYIDEEELVSFLSNDGQKNKVNASLFNGMKSDVFLKKTDVKTYSFEPDKHSSTSSTYGLGSTSEYGHVKLVDNLNSERYNAGEALSAHQGYEINKTLKEFNEGNSISQKVLHSHFNLIKRNGLVQLTIDDWDGVTWLNGRTGWQKIFDIPEGFRPVTFATSGVNYIYCPNLFGSNLRVRITTGDTPGVYIYLDGQSNNNFYGTVTWITRD